MLLKFFLIIFISTIIIAINAYEDGSEETKYIDLLPEKEKKDFIEKIARRILAEVSSIEVHKNKSQELTDSQLNTHSAYVAKLLKEESQNLRKKLQHYSTKEVDTNQNAKTDDAKETSAQVRDLEKALHKVNKLEDEELTNVLHKTVDVVRSEHEMSTTEKQKMLEEEISNIAKEQQQQNIGDLGKGVNSGKDEENKTKDILLEDKQDNENENDRADIHKVIDLTLRQIQETNLSTETTTVYSKDQLSESLISNATDNKNKKETISIEIEITENNNISDKNQIPVKVIYEDFNDSGYNTTQSTVETSTPKNNLLEKTVEKKSRRFDLDIKNDKIQNSDSQIIKTEEKRILDLKQKDYEELNNTTVKKDIIVSQPDKKETEIEKKTKKKNNTDSDSRSTITIKPEVLQKIMKEVLSTETNSESLSSQLPEIETFNPKLHNVPMQQDVLQEDIHIQENVPQELDIKQKSENEILREKRTPNFQDKSTENSANITETTIGNNEEIENKSEKSITIQTESSTLADITSATIAATNDSTTKENASDTTTGSTSTRNLEEESPTKIILLESGSTENVTIESSTVNGSTTEEIVKARTEFITGYPDEVTDDETEATIFLNVTRAETDDDSDMDIKELLNSSDTSIAPTSAAEVTESPLTTILADATTTTVTVNKKEVNNEKVLRNSEVDSLNFVTTTQITPLTTIAIEKPKDEEKKQFFYKMESPVVIENNGEGHVVEDKNVEKNNMETIKKIVDSISRNTLRHDLKPDHKNQDRSVKNSRNNKVQRKEYEVYELLPGQNPFQEKTLPFRKNPRHYPKLPKGNALSIKNWRNEHSSQIDHPNYAVIYKYDPKHAYYNPHNRYGPDNTQRDTDSTNARDNEKPFSSDSSSSKEDWSFRYDDKKHKRTNKPKPHLKQIDLDYYFGNDDKDFLRKKTVVECKVNIDDGDDSSAKQDCPSDEKIVYQNPTVPPNSDEYEHPHNAMLHKVPPLSHVRQTQMIMSLLGYHGYYSDSRHHKAATTSRPPTASGYTTMFTPPLDLFFSRLRKEDKFLGDQNKQKRYLRSGPINSQKKQYKVFNRYHMFVDEEPMNKNKYRVSSYSNKRKPNKNNNRFDKRNRLDHPLVILTGNAGINDENVKIKTGRFIPLDYLYQDLFAEPSNEQDKQDHVKLMQKFGELYYDDADDLGKQIKQKENSGSFDRDDPSSAKAIRLKEIQNFDAAQLFSNITVKSPIQKFRTSLLEQLEKLYNKGKTFKVNKKNNKNRNRFQKNLEAAINVLKDMINQKDNKALKRYNWLVTSVDIRSALTKLQNLSETTRLEDESVHPKDLQLLKYVLYLYTKVHSPEIEVEMPVPKVNYMEYPKNMRFLEDQDSQSPNFRRTFKILSVKDSDDDVPRNMRFLEPLKRKEKRNNDESQNIGKAHAVIERPWMSTEGMAPKLLEFETFLKSVEIALDDLHDAIRHIAEITNYRSQRWYENLKDLYLENPTRKKLLEVLLHLSFTRILDLINDSSKFGLLENYVKFSLENPKKVMQASAEFQVIVDILNEIETL